MPSRIRFGEWRIESDLNLEALVGEAVELRRHLLVTARHTPRTPSQRAKSKQYRKMLAPSVFVTQLAVAAVAPRVCAAVAPVSQQQQQQANTVRHSHTGCRAQTRSKCHSSMSVYLRQAEW